jgi:hypothetical protein
MPTNNSWNSQYPAQVAVGGTGDTTLTAYAVTCGGTTATNPVQSIASVGTAGQVLMSNGAGALPTFQAASGSSAIVTAYTAAAAGNHTFNANTKSFTVIAYGGGAGGGSGRRGASTNAGGGGGGAAGSVFHFTLPASFFGGGGGIVPYTVGAGGAGGTAQTVNDTNGNAGTIGGNTSFGSLVTFSQSAAAGGTNGAAIGGKWGPGYSEVSPGITLSEGGGSGSLTSASQTVNASINGLIGPEGGGGGGGADSVTERSGATGCDIQNINTTTILAGGAGGIESGTINGSNGQAGSALATAMVGGSGGGGGGGQSVGAVAGNGGNGGAPGGGGGGGGGSLNGTNSGAGGAGADGALYIIEYT